MKDKAIYSVSEITSAIRQTMEGVFPFVWVRGQVTGVSRPLSGHLYFSLRDEGASLAAVWFKGNQKQGERFDPLTGEVFEDGPKPCLALSLEDGQEILCAGRLSVYPLRGTYQLLVEMAHAVGEGQLHLEFERLKNKLALAGYFSQERKRPLPPNPCRVAIITAPGGAAIHDFLRIAETRGLGAEIRIYPALVQGEQAPALLREQLARALADQWAEVVVFIRGGGSIEDLWAFNDEHLAGAIKDSPVPVLAGIGHEVDFTLADMTADLRAVTPSHAAQLLWADRREFAAFLGNCLDRLDRAMARQREQRERGVREMARIIAAHAPHIRLGAWERQLRTASDRLLLASDRALQRRQTQWQSLDRASATMPTALATMAAHLERLEHRLSFGGEKALARATMRLERTLPALAALDPMAPLQRGYSLVYKAGGPLVHSISEAQPGEALLVRMADGSLRVTVDEDRHPAP
jgi:exodeoxyribonuclease VII, large subunit